MGVESFNRCFVKTAQIVVCGLLTSFTFSIFAQDAVIEKKEICPGVEHIHKQVQKVPWSIHVLKAERNRPDLDLITTMPSGEYLGLSPTTTQVKFISSEQGKPIGAVNGDFFSWPRGPYQGDVSGLQIIEGEVVSAPHLAGKNNDASHGAIAFWLDEKKNPHIDHVSSGFEIIWPDGAKTAFRLNEACDDDEAVIYTHNAGFTTRTTNSTDIILMRDGKNRWLPLHACENYSALITEVLKTNAPIRPDTLVLSLGPKILARLPEIKPGMRLKLSTATTPLLKNVKTALSGSPWLVHNGKANKVPEDVRHPRAAFGWNQTHYFFVVVDGRRKDISDGMKFPELAAEMVAQGCDEAINFDGGGSAMLWADGKILSQPSENRERPCGNALVLVQKPSAAHRRSPK